jgi:hypothetical protein
MINLDLGQWNQGSLLTFAKIVVRKAEYEMEEFDQNVEVDLKHWMGINNLPYSEYH